MAHGRLPLGRSIEEVIDTDRDELPLREQAAAQIRLNQAARREIERRMPALLPADEGVLAASGWFSDRWIRQVIEEAPREFDRAFDRAFDRWRELYRAAKRQRDAARAEEDRARTLEEQRRAKEGSLSLGLGAWRSAWARWTCGFWTAAGGGSTSRPTGSRTRAGSSRTVGGRADPVAGPLAARGFFRARRFAGLEEGLSRQLLEWLANVNEERPSRATKETPAVRPRADEERMRPLAVAPVDYGLRFAAHVGPGALVEFQGIRYAMPALSCGLPATLFLYPDRVRIVAGGRSLRGHPSALSPARTRR